LLLRGIHTILKGVGPVSPIQFLSLHRCCRSHTFRSNLLVATRRLRLRFTPFAPPERHVCYVFPPFLLWFFFLSEIHIPHKLFRKEKFIPFLVVADFPTSWRWRPFPVSSCPFNRFHLGTFHHRSVNLISPLIRFSPNPFFFFFFPRSSPSVPFCTPKELARTVFCARSLNFSQSRNTLSDYRRLGCLLPWHTRRLHFFQYHLVILFTFRIVIFCYTRHQTQRVPSFTLSNRFLDVAYLSIFSLNVFQCSWRAAMCVFFWFTGSFGLLLRIFPPLF